MLAMLASIAAERRMLRCGLWIRLLRLQDTNLSPVDDNRARACARLLISCQATGYASRVHGGSASSILDHDHPPDSGQVSRQPPAVSHSTHKCCQVDGGRDAVPHAKLLAQALDASMVCIRPGLSILQLVPLEHHVRGLGLNVHPIEQGRDKGTTCRRVHRLTGETT